MKMVNDMLKDNYHAYLGRAERVPQLMRECGLFSTEVRITGTDIKNGVVDRLLTFYQGGTLSVDESEEIPITALDRLLEATFAYNKRPTSLDYVPGIAMKTLNDALFEVERECEKLTAYRK